MAREPFVSGLPGRPFDPPRVADPVGVVMLRALRQWAAREAEERRPASRARFDGVERVAADPDAIAAVEACESVMRLVDGILADPLLARRAAELLRRPERR